jgi:hypothetical protein
MDNHDILEIKIGLVPDVDIGWCENHDYEQG